MTIRHSLLITLTLLALPLTSANAEAPKGEACLTELTTVMKTFDDQIPNSRVHTVISQGKETKQETKARYIDEKNFVSQSLRHNYWTMVRGNDEYRSRNGKEWEKFKTRPDDWAEKARAFNAKIITEVSNAVCGETEEVNGTTYKVYSYIHESELPARIKTSNKVYIEPKTGFRYRWISTLKITNPPTVLSNTFEQAEEVTLPEPTPGKAE